MRRLIASLFTLLVLAGTPLLAANDENIEPTQIVNVRMRDGVSIAVAIYRPKEDGRYPTLFAASAYRFDNNLLPPSPQFLWRETGPIAWYLKQGYAFVHMDVRGSGRSGGEYRFLDAAEQRDFYEVIEWIAQQPWSDGKVGGIGQSYYAMTQWFMGVQNPPHLACIAPYDGLIDNYRGFAYSGGITSKFTSAWYNGELRALNQYPSSGPPRTLPWDFPGEALQHPTYDGFWKERAAIEQLDKIKVPVFSIGIWSKVELHLQGNIVGYQRVNAPKKLLVTGSPNVFTAAADFNSIAFHEKYLLPFYDWCLKGKDTSYVNEPAVRYHMMGTDQVRSADSWPPKNLTYRSYYLKKGPTGSVRSLNDGALDTTAPDANGGETVFAYPNPDWRVGVVSMGPAGPDTVAKILTFTSPPLEEDLEVVGPIKLVLHASSTNTDTDFIVKLSEQFPQAEGEQGKVQPRFRVVSKGWLKASHREIDPSRSTEYAPWYTHDRPQPLEPGKPYTFEIAVMPAANLFKKGSRIRLEMANGDSPLTDFVFEHFYMPNKIGSDTIYHSAAQPSQILIPVLTKLKAEN
jgi:predicted acyl esterase